MWDDDNIAATVQAFNNAIQGEINVLGGPPPPAWLTNLPGVAAGAPITISGLKQATLQFADYTNGDKIIGNAMIAPNSVEEYKEVCSRFSHVGFEPFFREYAVCPIGYHYILKDNIKRTLGTRDPILAPQAHLGVSVFD
jgi:hypothetical protein